MQSRFKANQTVAILKQGRCCADKWLMYAEVNWVGLHYLTPDEPTECPHPTR